jgi:hypothetical protein
MYRVVSVCLDLAVPGYIGALYLINFFHSTCKWPVHVTTWLDVPHHYTKITVVPCVCVRPEGDRKPFDPS